MKKTYKVVCLLIFIIYSILFSSSLINNFDNSIKIGIKPTWIVNPYYNYSIYKGSINLINSKWSLYVEPVVTNSEVGKQILGTEFSRFDLNGRIVNALIKYNSKKVIVKPILKKEIYNLKKNIIQSGSKLYVDEFLKFENKYPSDLIEIHNRPNYFHLISKKIGNQKLVLYFYYLLFF